MEETPSYADRFLKGYSVFPDDSRIFHRTDCQYDFIAALTGCDYTDGVLKIAARLVSGEEVVIRLETVTPTLLRLRMGAADAQFDETSAMLMPLPERYQGVAFDAADTAYTLTTAGYRIELDKAPFCLRVISPGGETIFESETEDLVSLYTAPPLGLRRKDGDAWAFLSWRMRNEDRFFGLGEKFTLFEKTGTRATIWEADTCGSNTTDMSYKAVPVLLSTAGWALVLHTSFRSYWEIGSFSYATGAAMLADNKLDAFLILAPDLKAQIAAYTQLTGRPSLPPRWALGLWMSRAAYPDRAVLREVAQRLRTEHIPCDVFNIDPTWLKKDYYNDIGVEVCDFEWNEAPWGAPQPLFDEFSRQGFSICLWINPYLPEDTAAYPEALEKGYLVRTTTGGIAHLEFNLAAGIVDFTNPAAKAWWQDKLIDLLNKGAAVFKADFGDRVPEEALFYNGRTGKEMHNLYVHLYVAAVYEAVQKVKGTGMVWRRPGYMGSQRYPGTWAGDTQVTWEGMKGALRGGLSAAMTGEAFWSHDMGGFVGRKPSNELYIRWAQFGMLSPLARFHGTTPREPWYYGDGALEIVKYYAQLRYMLIPYLLAAAQESTQNGLPILRPMVLEFPGEPLIDQVDDQYLLGPDLLVAPLFKPGARTRSVYFPAGEWRRLEQPGEIVAGPGFHTVSAPLERAPVYVRAGAVIPRYAQAPEHLKGPTPRDWQLDIYPGLAERKLDIPEGDFSLSITYRSEGSHGELRISPAPLDIAVRLIACRPAFVEVNGAAVTWQIEDGYALVKVNASQGIVSTYDTTL
jgi:alpha-D-xyloside xylohydrolase